MKEISLGIIKMASNEGRLLGSNAKQAGMSRSWYGSDIDL
jgi:hypothetical protein